MKVEILNHIQLLQRVNLEPKQHDVLFIGNDWANVDQDIAEKIKEKSLNFKALWFDDIKRPVEGFVHPKEDHIKEAIEYAKDKDTLLVACKAGVSRSAATAYVICCSKMKPEEATKILNNGHWPNELVIEHGVSILNNEDVRNAMHRWKYNR